MKETDQQPQRVWSAALAHTVIKPVVVVMMGVSGSGKSTVAACLRRRWAASFRKATTCTRARTSRRCAAGRH